MKELSKIVEMAKITIKQNIAYTVSTWASIFVNIIQVAIIYYIWMAVYGGRSTVNGLSKTQMITYLILARIIWSQIENGINLKIAYMIRSGSIGVELLRPMDFRLLIYSSRIGDFVSYIFTNGIPVLIISSLIFGFSKPSGIIGGVFFFISLFLGITITFFIEFCVGLTSFYTSNGLGVHVLKISITSLLSGALIPLQFFPELARGIISWLPFQNMIYTPISIYLGIVSGKGIVYALIAQLLWVILLFLLTKLFFAVSIKKLIVQGG